MSLLENDPIFINGGASEWLHGHQIGSRHMGNDSIFYMNKTYVLFLYPRAFTPVCNEEIKALIGMDHKTDVEVIIGSADSPEAQQEFYQSEEYFGDVEVELPSITVRESDLTPEGRNLLLDGSGYTHRITVAVKDRQIVYAHREFSDEQRDVKESLRVIKKLI